MEFDLFGRIQVKIQKESEVRLKIIGTRVDATEIVSYSIQIILNRFEIQIMNTSQSYKPQLNQTIFSAQTLFSISSLETQILQ